MRLEVFAMFLFDWSLEIHMIRAKAFLWLDVILPSIFLSSEVTSHSHCWHCERGASVVKIASCIPLLWPCAFLATYERSHCVGEDITLNFREIDRALIYCFNPCLSNSWLWRNLEFLRNQDFVALISWFSFWFLTVSCLTILIACHGCFCFLLFFECEDNPNKPIAKNCLMNFNSQMKALAASENRKSVRTQDAKNVKVENAQMLWEHIQAKAKPFFAAQHFKLATMSPNDTEYWMWGLWDSFDKCASRGLSCWRWFLLSKCNKRYDSWRLVPRQNVQPVPRPALKPPSRGRKGLLETWNAKTHNSGISNLETLESQKQGSDRGRQFVLKPWASLAPCKPETDSLVSGKKASHI